MKLFKQSEERRAALRARVAEQLPDILDEDLSPFILAARPCRHNTDISRGFIVVTVVELC